MALNELAVNHEECGTSSLSCDGEVRDFFIVDLVRSSLLQFFNVTKQPDKLIELVIVSI